MDGPTRVTSNKWLVRCLRYGQLALAAVVVIACEVALLTHQGSERPILMGLIALPSVLSLFLAWDLGVVSTGRGLGLHTHSEMAERYPSSAEAVQKSWSYERDRYRRSVSRARFYATAFGLLATVFLTCSVLLMDYANSFAQTEVNKLQSVAVAVIAATVSVFLIRFATMTVRLSGHDFSARAFSWSARSLVLSVVATAGLALAVPVDPVWKALLLGVVVGIAGEHAMDFLLDKAPRIFNLAVESRQKGPSPLLAIEGLLAQHVSRLEEEGVLSIHDLAFAPTARLFFNTPYGLQMICDWQDQALLLVHMGPDRTRDLYSQMGIRGAIALRAAAEAVMHDAAESDALVKAMKLDAAAPTEPMLKAIVSDEATKRVEVHEQSVVLEPAQIDSTWSIADEQKTLPQMFQCGLPRTVIPPLSPPPRVSVRH